MIRFPHLFPINPLRIARRHLHKNGIPQVELSPDATLSPALQYWIQEPVWVVHVREEASDVIMLKSSRVILISKHTGKVIYDGSAHDEG